MKKRFIASVLFMSLMLSVFPCGAEETKAVSFADVSLTDKAYTAITYLVQKEIINGKTNTEFCPEDFLKREEFAKILFQLEALSETENAPIFIDVPAGVWYAPFVGSVAVSGDMTGISQYRFGTGLYLSRQDLAVVLYRYINKLGLPLEGDKLVLYADDGDISDYAREAVAKLSTLGIVTAASDNCFKPFDAVTRADAAVWIYELLMSEKRSDEKLGRYSASPTRWDGPYDTPMDDKLAENMPEIFDVSKRPTKEILTEDFNDSDYGDLVKGWGTESAVVSTTEGYGGSGCIKITDSGQLAFDFTSEIFEQGMQLVLECKIKAEGISKKDNLGNYRGIIQVRDGDKNWLCESGYTHRGALNVDTAQFDDADDGWITVSFMTKVPEVLNALSKTLYTIRLNCYMNGLSGTVYFDDFKVSTIMYDPMDTVLMSPNYKGLIYGEGGVGDIALRAHVHDYGGGYDLSKFKFVSKIVDENDNIYQEAHTENIVADMDVYFSSSGLKMGEDYYLESYIIDKETEEVIQKQSWTLRKRAADYRPKYYFDEDLRLIKDGEPEISTAIFHYSYADPVAGGFNMETVVGTDVDNFFSNGMRPWYSYGTSPDFRRDMQALYDNGKRYTLATGPFFYSQMIYGEISKHVKEQSDIRGYLSRVVNRFKDLPALECYYTQDERNALTLGEELRWQNEIIADNDLDHYTYGAICDRVESNPGIWAKTTDVIVSDPYPVTGLADQNLYEVTKFVKYLRETNPNRPVGVILQGFWFRDRSNKLGNDMRGPTQTEFRNMAFQALCEGASVVNTYAYGTEGSVTAASPGTTYQEEWAGRLEVFSEIERFEPIIVSNLPAPYYKALGGGTWLNSMSRRYDGKSYLFTVNNQDTEKSARFYLDGVNEITGMYSGKTYKSDKSGWFKIDFDALEVEVFEYEQPDYKSSHCELERFGLIADKEGIIIKNSEDETPIMIIPDGTTEVSFGAVFSKYAELYINGEKKDATGTINLGGLSELKVKVVSEDGRFSTEKTFLLTRG